MGCSAPQAGAASCTNGQCVISCSAGLSLCSGQCVDTNTDAHHCGSCATKCKSPSACLAGKCT
jgi:hypothetical protein